MFPMLTMFFVSIQPNKGQFRQAERLLQRIGTATQRTGGEEAIIGSNVQKSLAKKLQDLNTEFRHKQRKYLKDVQVQKSGGVAETESRFGIDINEREREYGLNETQLSAVVMDDLSEVAQSRDKEIAQIAKSIEELNAIFKELAVLVIDQGTILDRIDYNMESVVENTKAGIKQLEKAENKQKNSRPLKIIICLAITIFILLGILLLKHRVRTALSGGGGSSNNSGSSGNSNNNDNGSNTTSTLVNTTASATNSTNSTNSNSTKSNSTNFF
jgi:syntaxin 16